MELQVLAPPLPLDVGKFAALPITPDASSQDTLDGCCAILPKRTRVIVTGNNRTHRKLIGREAIVKKAVGLGGWHHIVLDNGEEVKLQRNALSVIELAADDGQDSSSDEMTEAREPQIEILTRPRIRRPPKALSPISDVMFKRHSQMPLFNSMRSPGSQHHVTLVNVNRLQTVSLRRYKRIFQLPDAHITESEGAAAAVAAHFSGPEIPPTHHRAASAAGPAAGLAASVSIPAAGATRDELVHVVSQHLAAQVLDEQQVLCDFVTAVQRRYKQQQLMIKQHPSHYGHLHSPLNQQQLPAHPPLFSNSMHRSLQHC